MQSQLLTENASRHAVYVQRVAGGLRNEFDAFLDLLRRDVSAWIVSTDYQIERQAALLKEVADIQAAIYADYQKQLVLDLGEFAVGESGWQARQLELIAPDDFVTKLPAPSQVIAAFKTLPLVMEDAAVAKQVQPFIKDWASSQVARVNSIIQTGFATGQTTSQIAKQIGGKGGVYDRQVRRSNEAMVITATNHASVVARREVMKENSDIVIGYRMIATLDDRTTTQCRHWDQTVVEWGGKLRYPDGTTKKLKYEPKPPFHPRCRTTTAPELDPAFTYKSETATRGAIGDAGRGTVGASSTYYGWLKRQSAEFQDQTIGQTRGALLRNGGLTSEEFARLTLDDKFRPLNLSEMREKNPEAFENAGLI